MADLELQSQETVALLKTSERPKKRALAIQLVALCGAAALAGAALASRAGANDVAVTGLARTNETLPAKPAANESVPVEVPDLKLTTPGFGVQGCGCSVQTCCDAINASGGYFAGYLGCAPVFETRGEICDQVTAGKLDGSLSVCDVPELANGPAQLTTTLVPQTCESIFFYTDTCVPVHAYNWWNIGIVGDGCESFTFDNSTVTISDLSRCHGYPGLPFSIQEGGELTNATNTKSYEISDSSENSNTCPPPFGTYGPTGYIYPSDEVSPGAAGRCVDLSNGQSIVFTVLGETQGVWPCDAPQTPAPTPHHHHHDGAVAELRDAALGSLVVAALTAAVLL